mgnify:CR=1 FL=1
MKSVFTHTQSNILVIPQALFALKDVSVLLHNRNSAIFYKNLENDLTDVEFYTNVPCFIYIESGREVLSTENDECIELNEGTAIFLSQGLTLQSDFVRKTENLSAYLVFFDDEVIINYLRKLTRVDFKLQARPHHCIFDKPNRFSKFFESIEYDIQSYEYLKVKLEELLHLIAWKSNTQNFLMSLAQMRRSPPKQNITHILETYDVFHLSIADLAHLSGRSPSSFQRDFKKNYGTSPGKWLQEKKLYRAKELLTNDELTVTEVALTLGYENISAFITAFKRKYGITPKQIKSRK